MPIQIMGKGYRGDAAVDDEPQFKIGPLELQKLRHSLVRSAQFAFLLLLCGGGIYYGQKLLFEQKAPVMAQSLQIWMPPEGYTPDVTYEDIAYGHRWLAKDEYKCILFERCAGLGVVLSRDCPESLTVEADLLNKAGDKVSRARSMVPLVTADEKTRILLTYDTAEAVSARISRVMCR
jgi:hypothetical protein